MLDDFSEVSFDRERAAYLAPTIRMLYNPNGAITLFYASEITNKKVHDLFVEAYEDAEEQTVAIQKAHAEYVEENRVAPSVIAVEKLGYFISGDDMKQVQDAKEQLIVNGKAEKNHEKVPLGGNPVKRLERKIALVTGSAQGFGKGIALAMAEHGAHVMIADINYDGAVACAEEINSKFGVHTAFAVKVNVGDETSVKEMFETTALTFGGLDVFVNNAGIVRAGGLEEMTMDNFELVTHINYTAYYLCTKYASKIMKLQNRVAPDYMMDIIQINSKSGLAGSNKNFAYAGSKFGGIGLTQSFALELAPYQIKVNAICPGNLLDGPLWSDPERGLFVQYLNAGKVPGAKTVADVKRFYESKVPMNRGCREEDVVVAILYLIEQKYETGQAVPVTGGQEMLK